MKYPTGRPANVVDVLSGEINVDTILSPTGTLTLGGTGATDEIWTANFRDVDNSVLFSTTSGVIGTDWNADFHVGARFGEGNRVLPAAGADHRIRAYSNDVTQANDYIEMYHDQVDGFISVGGGDISIYAPQEIKFNSGWGTFKYDYDGTAIFQIRGSTSSDEVKWGLADESGNQIVIVNSNNVSYDHDHNVQTDPTIYIHSDIDPNVSNNQWGSFAHNQEDFIITTGVNVGTGSAPTTDDNSIIFAPRGTEAVKVGGNGSMIYLPDSDTIADSGDGNPATATLNPTKSYVKITCNDSDTCDVTMGEATAVDGQIVDIVNISANVVDFADTSGVSELNGAYAMGQWQTLALKYVDDRWVEFGRSAN